MKMLFDYFPIIVFFATFKLFDNNMIIATESGIAASFLQVALFWLRYRRFEKMHLITFALISIFGGITIALDDPLYIKWKTTILEWVFALVFLGSQFFGKRNLVERMMGAAIKASDKVWRTLNYAWVVFFTTMGFLNLYVLYNFDDDTWVNFKFFGMLGLTVIFTILQGIYVMRHDEAEILEVKKESGISEQEGKE